MTVSYVFKPEIRGSDPAGVVCAVRKTSTKKNHRVLEFERNRAAWTSVLLIFVFALVVSKIEDTPRRSCVFSWATFRRIQNLMPLRVQHRFFYDGLSHSTDNACWVGPPIFLSENSGQLCCPEFSGKSRRPSCSCYSFFFCMFLEIPESYLFSVSENS